MSTALIISFSDLARDPRVNRQIRFLHEAYDVVAFGLASPEIPGVRFLASGPGAKPSSNFWLRKARGAIRKAKFAWRWTSGNLDGHYWDQPFVAEALQLLARQRADLIIANDAIALPLARRLAENWQAKLIFDAHEYAPREFDDVWRWRWFEAPFVNHICRQYIPRADAMITVCPGIADAYAELTGKRATVVTNAPDYEDLPAQLHNSGQPVRLVHHGNAFPSRKLENMIEVMNHVDRRFELTFMLMSEEGGYRRRLEQRAAQTGRVRFLPPVEMRALPRFLNQFDIGLYVLEPINFNHLHALPNKLFEFIQARLAVAIGPSPEMARVVTEAGVGIVAADFQPATLAAALNRLSSQDINAYKKRAHDAAREYSAQRNRQVLLDICQNLCPSRGARAAQPREAA